MKLNTYRDFTRKTAIYPEARRGTRRALAYCALGLCGEAGEVANKVKKLDCDGDTALKRMGIREELGDVAWYFVRLCDELGIDPDSVLRASVVKLSDQKSKGDPARTEPEEGR